MGLNPIWCTIITINTIYNKVVIMDKKRTWIGRQLFAIKNVMIAFIPFIFIGGISIGCRYLFNNLVVGIVSFFVISIIYMVLVSKYPNNIITKTLQKL